MIIFTVLPLLLLCPGERRCQDDSRDFVDMANGYEFIYHDLRNMMLILHRDDCFFINFPDSEEGQLVNTDAHYQLEGNDTEFQSSSLRLTENSLLQQVLYNRSGNVLRTDLAEVRDRFQDRLADYHCTGKNIFELPLQPSSGQTADSAEFSCVGLDEGLHPHPQDCRKFVVCSNGRTFIEQCAWGTAFAVGIPGCTYPGLVPSCNQ